MRKLFFKTSKNALLMLKCNVRSFTSGLETEMNHLFLGPQPTFGPNSMKSVSKLTTLQTKEVKT